MPCMPGSSRCSKLDHPSEQVEFLAHHAGKAEAWEKAVRYLRQAGTKALERSANREARTLFEQALAAGRQLPGDARDPGAEDRHCVRSPYCALAARRTRSGSSSISRGPKPSLSVWAISAGWDGSAQLANYRFWRGDPEGAVAAGHRALTIATAVDDFGLRVLAEPPARSRLPCPGRLSAGHRSPAAECRCAARRSDLSEIPYGRSHRRGRPVLSRVVTRRAGAVLRGDRPGPGSRRVRRGGGAPHEPRQRLLRYWRRFSPS